MKKQMVELNLLSERAKGSAGSSSLSQWNHMEKLPLGTLVAKCDTELCISHVSSLPSVISAFCLLELAGPLQGDKEAAAQ